MTERQALASRNFHQLAYSKNFPFIRHCQLIRGYLGMIEVEGHIFHYRFMNDISQDSIELKLDLPIVCNRNNINDILGYFITLNLIFQNQGVFSLDKRNRLTVWKRISYKYFAPSVQTLEWQLAGLITLAGESYDVINAIAEKDHVPNNQKASSRIYYDVFLKDVLIKTMDTDTLRLNKAFFPSTDEFVVGSFESSENSTDDEFGDLDLDDDEWGALFF